MCVGCGLLTSLSLLCRMSLKPGSRFGSLLTSSNASLAAGMHACPPCHPPLPAMGKMPPMCSSSGRPASLPSSRGEAIKQSKNIQNVTAPSLVISCWNVNVQNVITAFAFANTNRKSNKMAEQAGRTKYGNGRKWGETRRGESSRVEEAKPKRPFKRRFMCPPDFYDSLSYVYS